MLKVINKLRNELKRMCKELKNKNVGELLTQLMHDKDVDYFLWKVKIQIKWPKQIQIIQMQLYGTWGRISKQKVQLFAEYLSSTSQPLPGQTV